MGTEGLIMRLIGKRAYGELYILSTENNALYTHRNFNGKRYMYHRIYLSKSEANGAADANRDRGFLARVVPKMVWTNKTGYERGIEKMQGYVLYVHRKAVYGLYNNHIGD
jgi:hypothetical protein